MIGATIVLTAVYWLSDLAVAMWMGGLLTVSLLLGLPLDVSPAGDPMLLANGASTAVEMILRPRPYIFGAALILLASVVIGVILERRARRSFAWWVIWLLRSLSGLFMFIVAIYSFGNLDPYITKMQNSVDTLKKSLAVQASAESAVQDGSQELSRVMENPYDAATVETLKADFTALQNRYRHWMWIQLLLGSAVLFAGALKQAAWRRSWGKEKEQAAEGPEKESSAPLQSPEKDGRSPEGETPQPR